jgi:hypothetical protein
MSLYSNNASAFFDPQNVPKPSKSGPETKRLNLKAILKIQKRAKIWLRKLGFDMDEYAQQMQMQGKGFTPKDTLSRHSTILEDPIRNGFLLSLIGSKLYGENIEEVIIYPSSIRQCKKNMACAFSIFRNYSDDYPYELLYKEDEILKGCPNTTWQFIEALMQAWKEQF